MENSKQPAFPHVAFNQQGEYTTSPFANGLTKREYFAAMAMQGLASNIGKFTTLEYVSKTAVEVADAVLLELQKK